MDFVVGIPIAVLICAVLKWIWDRYTLYNIFERMGIPGPKPTSFLFGNMLDVMKHGRVPLYKKWSNSYGQQPYGYFEGSQPVIVTQNLSHVREVLIKQFDKFSERRVFINNDHDDRAHMGDIAGERWKKVRSVATPTFSSKNMKRMSPLVHLSIDKLLVSLRKHCKTNNPAGFDISKEFYKMTLDSIASVVFSYDADPFGEKESPFIKHLNILFAEFDPKLWSWYRKLVLSACFIFPSLQTFIKTVFPSSYILGSESNEWFLELAKRMIEERQRSGEVHADYLQLMLNTGKPKVSNDPGTDTDGSDGELSQELRSLRKKKSLSMTEMQGQALVFLAAGYETTANTLGNLMHYLSLNQDKQEQLYQEIAEHFTDGVEVNYETVQKLHYLDMTFHEVSRLSNIGLIGLTRICNQSTQVGNLAIAKGVKVCVDSNAIHHDLSHWGPEPTDQFVPERFSAERKAARDTMAYLPFGAGPKSCVGMRFGILESKMAIVNVIKNFSILTCEKTENPLKRTVDGVISPINGVFVRLEERY